MKRYLFFFCRIKSCYIINMLGFTMRKLIAVIFILFLPSLVFAEPLGFRDFKMGTSREEIRSSYEKSDFNRDRCWDADCCEKSYKVHEIPVSALFCFNSAYIKSDKVNHIVIIFKSDSYSDMKESLIEKYGGGYKCWQYGVQNGMGAKFINETCEWKFKEGLVSLSQYGDTLEYGTIGLSDNENLKALQKGKIKKGAGF